VADKSKLRCHATGMVYEDGRAGTSNPVAERRDGLYYSMFVRMQHKANIMLHI